MEVGSSASGDTVDTASGTGVSASDSEAATNSKNTLQSKQEVRGHPCFHPRLYSLHRSSLWGLPWMLWCYNVICSVSFETVGDIHVMFVIIQGPYEYELFSIMIHSGSAAGGHYYAYIKWVLTSYQVICKSAFLWGHNVVTIRWFLWWTGFSFRCHFMVSQNLLCSLQIILWWTLVQLQWSACVTCKLNTFRLHRSINIAISNDWLWIPYLNYRSQMMTSRRPMEDLPTPRVTIPQLTPGELTLMQTKSSSSMSPCTWLWIILASLDSSTNAYMLMYRQIDKAKNKGNK